MVEFSKYGITCCRAVVSGLWHRVTLGRIDNGGETCPIPDILEKKVADTTGHKAPPHGDVHQTVNEFGTFEVLPCRRGLLRPPYR
jgi:hypothetical protein